MPVHRPLRIAVIAPPPRPGASGVANTIRRLDHGLRARGHDVRSMLPPEPEAALADLDRQAALAGIRTLMAAQRSALELAWTGWRPEVVHVELADEFAHVARRLAASRGIRVSARFHHLHEFAPQPQRETALSLLLAFHRGIERTVAQTSAQAAFLGDHGVANVTTITNGVDLHRFDPSLRSAALRRSWGASPEAPVAIWIGRLVEAKNTALLARAGEALHDAMPSARLVVVGDGRERSALAARLPWAHFTGELGGSELPEHLASADLLMFPSRIDAWGNAVTEAMASGTAVVAFARGAARELLTDGSAGLTIADGDEPAFIQAVLALGRDLPRCRQLGSAGRRLAMRHGWDGFIDRFEALFTDLVATHR